MINALSYVGFSSPNAASWLTFAPDILGLEASESGGTVLLRLDEAKWRLAIHPGDVNLLEYIGWDVGSSETLQEAVQHLQNAGVTVNVDDRELSHTRSAAEVVWFLDPFGFRHELVYGLEEGDTPFSSPAGVTGFVTGENGLGHIVLMVPELKAATKFFVGTLGFRHSDDIEMGLHVRFLHCNPRHHTLAMTELPGHRGVHHLMLEVKDIDDVGRAYDRAIAANCPIAMTLGRHTNDQMTSFYLRTPSGFEVEYGCGGLLIDTGREWPVGHYDAMSYWGHKPPAEPLLPGIIQPV